MKKNILFVVLLAVVMSLFAGVVMAADDATAGPYIPMRNGNLNWGTVYLSDSVTSTKTAMRTVVGVGNSAAGICSITGLGFRSINDYFIVVTEEAATRTFNANAPAIVYEGGNSCTVYTNALTAAVRFQAVGRY